MAFRQILPLQPWPQNGGYLTYFLVSYVCALLTQDQTTLLTVYFQVKFVIDEAVGLDNLCQLYEGWTPWV